jgi:hypothetical protein
MKAALICVLIAVGGLVAWRTHHATNSPERAVNRWLESLATADPIEFCATTTPLLRDGNFSEVGAHGGSCEVRAMVLLNRYQRYWAAFSGARATRSSRFGGVAEVATTDIVLPDGARMNDYAFGLFPHPANHIRLVQRGRVWLVDG